MIYCKVILYCTILYYTILYYTILYCTVLYCTVLYCSILQHKTPLGRRRPGAAAACAFRLRSPSPASQMPWVLPASVNRSTPPKTTDVGT